MKKTNFLLLGILIVVSLLACKKNTDNVYIKPPSNKELLRAGSPWILVEARAKVDNGEWTSFYENTPACLTDNVFTFPTDSTYTITEGNIKCDLNDPDVVRSGRFELRDQETQMFFIDTTIVYNTPPTPNDTIYTYNQELLLSITADNFVFVTIDSTTRGIITSERKYGRQ